MTLVDQIMAGQRVCDGAVALDCARRIDAVADYWDRRGPHTPDTCRSAKPKDCTHGQGDNRWFADVRRQDARDRCASWCGQHR